MMVAGSDRSSRPSIPGLNRRDSGWLRPEPAMGVPRIWDIIRLRFFNMTRAFLLCSVILPSRQAMGLIAAMISRARYPVIRRRGAKHVRRESAFFGSVAGHGGVEPGA